MDRRSFLTCQRRSFAGRDSLSLGAWVVVLIGIVSSVLVAMRPTTKRHGLEMWTRSRNHFLLYEPIVNRWNEQHEPAEQVQLYLICDQVLERRMLSGFLADTRAADLIEIERSMAGRVFSGPLEDVGFADLTERLRDEGIYDQLNEPSFGPWTSREHVFGLPHDVHPVLMAYRADLVEAAGINVSTIETWDDFVRVMRPLAQDLDGDGRVDRYPLSLWHTNMDLTELLILQAGGRYFDEHGQPVISSDVNAMVLAHIVSWTTGPNRIAADAPEFSAAGNQMRLEGLVVCSLMPDWLGGVWRQDMPALDGKLKLMPLPAWEPGGRRTSVWGGSMLGVARTTPDFQRAWAFAKHLYLSPDLAEQLYATTGIISPAKNLWPSAFYDEPSSYFCGQAPGRRFIEYAPHVPRRTSSPYNMIAKSHVRDAAIDLRRWAEANEVYGPAELQAEARRVLDYAEQQVRRQMERNVFLQVGEQ